MNEKQYLTKVVQDHEQYIRTGTSIACGDYGDVDYAAYELEEHLVCAGYDNWKMDWEKQDWFMRLARRQARCNCYETN